MTGHVLRSDGSYTLYGVQHLSFGDEWVGTSTEHIIFGRMSYEEKRGEKGDLYRDVLSKSRDAWQDTSLHVTENLEHALAVLVLCRLESPEMKFRLAKYEITQTTEEVA